MTEQKKSLPGSMFDESTPLGQWGLEAKKKIITAKTNEGKKTTLEEYLS